MAEPEPARPEPKRTLPISWDQFHRDCRTLAARLENLGPFHAIVCISRGGLAPAAIIARELGIRMIETVCVASYSHTTQGEMKVIKDVASAVQRRDSADRARACSLSTTWSIPARPPRWCGRCCRAPISPPSMPSRSGRPLVDTFITEVPQDTWIYFPWDTGLAFHPPHPRGRVVDGGLRSACLVALSAARL